MRYRKRPIEVEAVRWTGENIAEIADFTDGHRSVVYDHSSHSLFATTSEGQRRCASGDWLVKLDDGYYPFTDEAFRADFEAVNVLETA